MKLSKKNSMKFLNRFQFLFKNIYILYTLFIVSVIYVFMLISFHNINAVAFFLILGVVLYCYTKNMSIILSVCLILTLIIFPMKITNKKRKEGLENSTSTDTSTTTGGTSSTTTTPSTTSTTSSTTTPSTTTPSTTTTSDDVATSSSTSTGGTSSSKKEPTGTSSVTPTDSFTGSLAGQSRIDPAATMTQAFNNLENMLGGEGISKLSNDTQTLVANQAKLFKTIENMTPLIEKASNLMNKFSKF